MIVVVAAVSALVGVVIGLMAEVLRLQARIEKLEAIIPRTVWAALEKAREAKPVTTWPWPASPRKCLVCDGRGLVSRPPWIAGDQTEWSSAGQTTRPCKACKGKGIIWQAGGEGKEAKP